MFLACVLTLASGCASVGSRRVARIPAPPPTAAATTVETQDKALAGALARLAVRPSAETHKAVGREYRRLGLLEQAFDQFGAATHLDRRDAEAYDARARIWRDWGFPGRGMGDAARAVYFASQSAAAHNTWGTLLAASGLIAHAQEQFDRARALDPAAAYAVTNSCYVAFVAGQISRALADCRRALDLDSGSVITGNDFALSLAAAGQLDAAQEQFMARGDRMTGRYNAGLAYLAAGRFGEASTAFDSVSGTHPLAKLARIRAAQARALVGAPAADADGSHER